MNLSNQKKYRQLEKIKDENTRVSGYKEVYFQFGGIAPSNASS